MTIENVKAWILGEMRGSYNYQPQPDTVEVIEDPKVDGTFAVRFRDERMKYNVNLLFVTSQCRQADDPNNPASVLSAVLEECEFSSWPPKSGSPSFF